MMLTSTGFAMAFVALLVVACRDTPPTTPQPPSEEHDDARDAAPSSPLLDAPTRGDAPSDHVSWTIDRLSSDGKHVLLQAGQAGGDIKLHFRVIETDTNVVEADVDLPVLSALANRSINIVERSDSAAEVLRNEVVAAELNHIAPVLSAFPLGTTAGPHWSLASAPDGRHTALSYNGWIFTAEDGRITARISECSIAAWFAPDGKGLLCRDYVGYATSIDGKRAARKLVGTGGSVSDFALSDRNAVRIVVQTCVVEIGLAAPYPVRRLACLEGNEHLWYCALSPKGAWVACTTTKRIVTNGKSDTRHRLRTMEVATGRVYLDRFDFGWVDAISDDGAVVRGDRRPGNRQILVTDRHGETRTLPGFGAAQFRSTTELVIENNGVVSVIDTARR
jgi:hypothetical protein